MSHGIHDSLKNLLEWKTKKDGSEFTIYKLAKALAMPHSVLIKLMHQEPEKRVQNPRIDTLEKIVNFFRDDGLSITIDSFLTGITKKNISEIHSQTISNTTSLVDINIFNIENTNEIIGSSSIKIDTPNGNYIGYQTASDIGEIFDKGSIFIIDKNKMPYHNSLVAIRFDGQVMVEIKKYCIQDGAQLLFDFNISSSPMKILPTSNIQFIGVVVQVNIKSN